MPPLNAGTAAARADEEENGHQPNSCAYSDGEQTEEDDDGGVYHGDEDDGYHSASCADMCRAPLNALTRPVEVGELGS